MHQRAFISIVVASAAVGAGCRDRSATTVEGGAVMKVAAAHGVTLVDLACETVPKIRAESRCLASAPPNEARKLAASLAFERGTPSSARSTQPAYAGGCGSLDAVVGATGVEVYTYVPGTSPRVAWNEIWVMPLEGRVCIELSHAKES